MHNILLGFHFQTLQQPETQTKMKQEWLWHKSVNVLECPETLPQCGFIVICTSLVSRFSLHTTYLFSCILGSDFHHSSCYTDWISTNNHVTKLPPRLVLMFPVFAYLGSQRWAAAMCFLGLTVSWMLCLSWTWAMLTAWWWLYWHNALGWQFWIWHEFLSLNSLLDPVTQVQQRGAQKTIKFNFIYISLLVQL